MIREEVQAKLNVPRQERSGPRGPASAEKENRRVGVEGGEGKEPASGRRLAVGGSR